MKVFINVYRESKQEAIRAYAKPSKPQTTLFRALDSSGAGYLTSRELRRFAKRLGVKLASLMRQMDANGDGRVSRAEFEAWERKISR